MSRYYYMNDDNNNYVTTNNNSNNEALENLLDKLELNITYNKKKQKNKPYIPKQLRIKKRIFNNPATIVYWEDGTKTIVKCMNEDTYDRDVGLAMCICKKVLGTNYRSYFRNQVKYTKEEINAEVNKLKNEEEKQNLREQLESYNKSL